jgi:hypothetical protein
VQKWLSDPVLSAGSANCQLGAPFPIGANGIVIDKGLVTIANTRAALIASIPIQGDGTAGTPAASMESSTRETGSSAWRRARRR